MLNIIESVCERLRWRNITLPRIGMLSPESARRRRTRCWFDIANLPIRAGMI